MTLAIILIWIVSGAFAYALTFAFFQREYPELAEWQRRDNRAFAIFFGLLGPLGLVVAFVSSGFGEHGLKWK